MPQDKKKKKRTYTYRKKQDPLADIGKSEKKLAEEYGMHDPRGMSLEEIYNTSPGVYTTEKEKLRALKHLKSKEYRRRQEQRKGAAQKLAESPHATRKQAAEARKVTKAAKKKVTRKRRARKDVEAESRARAGSRIVRS